MRDEALKSAIDYVGGQAELARRIGTFQPNVSRWKKTPAEFVIPVEKATDGHISRYQLRPDIYPQDQPQ